MKDKKDCKIVQDLLPNYIEKLTAVESNKFIEEHILTCKECKEIQENMQKDLDVNSKKSNKKEVNYFKKYNKKLRVLKIILLLILSVFLVRTVRNMIIFSSLENKADEYISSTNYHRKNITYLGDSMNVVDSYYKDGKSVTIIQRLTEQSISKIKVYNHENNTHSMYFETGNTKTAQINKEGNSLITHTIDYCESYNIFVLLARSILANIKSVECNNKQCYLIDDYLLRETGTYIDKETGLVVRINQNDLAASIDGLMDVQYEFGTVTDDIFVEPDITEYEVQK